MREVGGFAEEDAPDAGRLIPCVKLDPNDDEPEGLCVLLLPLRPTPLLDDEPPTEPIAVRVLMGLESGACTTLPLPLYCFDGGLLMARWPHRARNDETRVTMRSVNDQMVGRLD